MVDGDDHERISAIRKRLVEKYNKFEPTVEQYHASLDEMGELADNFNKMMEVIFSKDEQQRLKESEIKKLLNTPLSLKPATTHSSGLFVELTIKAV